MPAVISTDFIGHGTTGLIKANCSATDCAVWDADGKLLIQTVAIVSLLSDWMRAFSAIDCWYRLFRAVVRVSCSKPDISYSSGQCYRFLNAVSLTCFETA